MNSDDADEARKRLLFGAALRDFSNACEAPLLTTSCPFYQMSDGGAWCLEECIDLLAEHGRSGPEGLEISGGFRVSPLHVRPRRGPSRAAKPFDAAEVHLSDRSKPTSAWRPSALLVELRDQTSPPVDLSGADGEKRGARLSDVIDGLRPYDIDGERILRGVLVRGMAHGIAMRVALPILLASSPDLLELPPELDGGIDNWSDRIAGCSREPSEWFDWAKDASNSDVADVLDGVFKSLTKVERWLRRLPLEELAIWRCPTEEEFASVFDSDVAGAEGEPIDRWIYDRFVNTYLERWNFDSLILEWKYLHGEKPAPVSQEAMRTRHLPADEVARVVAARVAAGEDRQRDTTMTVAHFVAPAVEHLTQGRFSAAAALFDACRIAAPTDPEAHNNYGFCMIPEDPQTALEALERAADLGMRFEPVNVANRMHVLYSLHREATALEIAGRFAASQGWRKVHGFLWSWSTEQVVLQEVEDVRLYVADLAVHIATMVRDEVALREWQRRRGELTGPPTSAS